MKKPAKRSIVLMAGVSALVVGGTVAAVADTIDDYAVDPSQSELTITDELFSDGEPVSTTVITYDAEGKVIEKSITQH